MQEHTFEPSTNPYPEAKEIEDVLIKHGETLAKRDKGKQPLPWASSVQSLSKGGKDCEG